MSRTTRRHEARSRSARRGPKNPRQEPRRIRKPEKQARANNRIQLKREWT